MKSIYWEVHAVLLGILGLNFALISIYFLVFKALIYLSSLFLILGFNSIQFGFIIHNSQQNKTEDALTRDDV